MTDHTEFWEIGGQSGARDQQFHARSQEECPDVRIRLLEGIAAGEAITPDLRLKYDRLARDEVLREELAMDSRVDLAMSQERRALDLKVHELKSELQSLPVRHINRNPFNMTTRATATTKAVKSIEGSFEADRLTKYLVGDEAVCSAYIRSLVENADPQGKSDMLGTPRAVGKRGTESSCQVVEPATNNVAVVGDGTCFRCGSDKHLVKECTLPDPRPPKPPGRRFERACYEGFLGRHGELIRDQVIS